MKTIITLFTIVTISITGFSQSPHKSYLGIEYTSLIEIESPSKHLNANAYRLSGSWISKIGIGVRSTIGYTQHESDQFNWRMGQVFIGPNYHYLPANWVLLEGALLPGFLYTKTGFAAWTDQNGNLVFQESVKDATFAISGNLSIALLPGKEKSNGIGVDLSYLNSKTNVTLQQYVPGASNKNHYLNYQMLGIGVFYRRYLLR